LLLRPSAGTEERYRIVEPRKIHAKLVQKKMNVIATIFLNMARIVPPFSL